METSYDIFNAGKYYFVQFKRRDEAVLFWLLSRLYITRDLKTEEILPENLKVKMNGETYALDLAD
jgi:hypothetical protein